MSAEPGLVTTGVTRLLGTQGLGRREPTLGKTPASAADSTAEEKIRTYRAGFKWVPGNEEAGGVENAISACPIDASDPVSADPIETAEPRPFSPFQSVEDAIRAYRADFKWAPKPDKAEAAEDTISAHRVDVSGQIETTEPHPLSPFQPDIRHQATPPSSIETIRVDRSAERIDQVDQTFAQLPEDCTVEDAIRAYRADFKWAPAPDKAEGAENTISAHRFYVSRPVRTDPVETAQPRPFLRPGPDSSHPSSLIEAMYAYRSQRWKDAVDLVDEFLAQSPEDRAALELGGRAAHKMRDWAAAVQFWDRLGQLNLNRPGPAQEIAHALIENGEAEEARQLVDRLLDRLPNSVPLLELKLNALLLLGNAEQTVAFISQMTQHEWEAENTHFLMRLIRVCHETGNPQHASEWLEPLNELCERLKAVGNSRHLLEANLLRARAAYKADDRIAAASFYAAALVHRPDHEESAAYLVGQYLAQGDAASAETIVSQFPDVPQSISARHWWRVQVHDARGETEQADRLTLEGIERFAGDQQYSIKAGNYLIGRRQPAKALAIADTFLEKQPDSTGLLQLRLSALCGIGNAEQIKNWVVQLQSRSWTANDIPFLTRTAHQLVQSGNFAAAADWIDHIESAVPASSELLLLRARLAYAESRHTDLRAICAQLAEVGTPEQQFEAHLLRARSAHNVGDAANATVFYAESFRRRATHEESAGYLVQRYLALHDAAAAEKVLAEFGGDPTLPMRQWWGALIEDAKGDPQRARTLLKDGLERFPEDARFRSNVASFFVERSDIPEAVRLLEEGLRRQPESLPLLIRLLQSHLRAERPAATVLELCDRILKLDSQNQDALLQRGNSLVRLARRREALLAYEEGTQIFAGNVTFWRSAVATSLMLGDEDNAQTILQRAREAFAVPSPQNFVSLADIFDAADVEDEAMRMAAAALHADPNHLPAQQIAARLYSTYGYFDRAWPLLLELQQAADRPIRTVQTYAQVAAARHALASLGGTLQNDARYPDVLFHAIARTSAAGKLPWVPDDDPPRGIVHVISTLAAGGSERQLAATVAGLAARPNIDVSLAVEDLNPVYGRDFFLPQIADSGVDVHWLDKARVAGFWRDRLAKTADCRWAVQAIASMPTEVIKVALPLYALLIEKRPQAVHLWQDTICIAGGIAAVLAGVPCIVMNTRSTRPVERQRARRYLHAGFSELLSRPGTLLLNNSNAGARDYEAWLQLPEGAVQVLHNGYDFDAIRGRTNDAASAGIRAELGIPEDAPVLGGVMRCSFEKRPELWTEVAIDLADRMPDMHAILVGDGPMLPQLRDRVAQAGHSHRIHYAGQRTPIEPWMRAMNVLFLSSLTEGMPNVLIEAQALGVPVATMRVGGAPETVSDGRTGIVIDAGPVSTIAASIGELLRDAERRARFAENAYPWVAAEFSSELILSRLLAIYDAAAARSRDRIEA